MKTVHVAAGIIQRGDGSDEVLAVQRGYGSMAGMWEFPGGKVERGESAADACVRELAEELQVRVENLRAFYTVEYDYPDFHLSMECFFCRIAEGEGEPVRHDKQQDMRWVPRAQLADFAWMPADIGLVEALVASAQIDSRNNQTDGAAGADGTAGKPSETPSKPKGKKRPGKRKRKKAAKKKKPLLDGIDTSDLTAQETQLVRRRAAIRKSMQGNKRADTKPEMLVRQRLRAAGLPGYRLQWKKAPGRPDIAFPGRKIAIFVNGCFWHRCPRCHPSAPKRNVAFWETKFARNVERDRQALRKLQELGWTAIVIWECELKRDRIDTTMERVIEQVRQTTRQAK